ncbi:protein midgut expression 1 isoform X2 [Lucilia sericata]|uniref:protein midgut expression 1 isoform X1 n=1 Tax=Lucilia sericata TaxID=13632 RepID=UPI0018A80747|nr:protein midgut expression 1 isoform X1 [Lucilia sericata]XP_037828548.1 protein midgut expression 1 isoform X2 [Lucilia sericata]
MCKCLAGNVACCCLNCAVGVLMSIISAFLVIIIIVGIVVYFVYYHDGDHSDDVQNSVDKFKNALSDNFDKASKILND